MGSISKDTVIEWLVASVSGCVGVGVGGVGGVVVVVVGGGGVVVGGIGGIGGIVVVVVGDGVVGIVVDNP
jgi:hypothetical protein